MVLGILKAGADKSKRDQRDTAERWRATASCSPLLMSQNTARNYPQCVKKISMKLKIEGGRHLDLRKTPPKFLQLIEKAQAEVDRSWLVVSSRELCNPEPEHAKKFLI